MNNRNRLEEFINSPKASLWKLSIPKMLGMSVRAIYMLVDTAFIGNWVGYKALSGLGFVFPPMFIIMGITFGLGSGGTTIIAQYIGKNDKKVQIILLSIYFLIGLIITFIFILIGILGGQNILKFQVVQMEQA